MNKRGGLARGTQTHQREQRGNIRVNLTQEQRDSIPTIMAPSERTRLSNAINLAIQESDRELGDLDYIEIVNRLQSTAIHALDLISLHQHMDIDQIINGLIIDYLDQYRGRI